MITTSRTPFRSAPRLRSVRRCAICAGTRGPGNPSSALRESFEEFDKLFTGRMPGYHGVDTVYHDRQHSLDVTLASGPAARRLREIGRIGRCASGPSAPRSGSSRPCFTTPATSASRTTRSTNNGAEFTLYHVTRSARFLARYLPRIGMDAWTPVATRLVHFTGYELKPSQIQLVDERDRKLGAHARHRRPDRADGRPLLPGKMPRPAVPGIRARRRRDGDGERRRAAGPLQLGASTCCATRRIRARDARGAAGQGVRHMPIGISSRCSAARTRTSRRSTATSVT